MKRHLTILIFPLLVASVRTSGQKQGQPLIDSLLKELPIQKEDTNKVKLLNDLSFAYNTINPNEGLKYGQQSMEIAEKLDWKKGISGANNNLGVNYESKSDYPKAMEYFQQALKMYEEMRSKQGIASVTGNIGIIYDYQGDYPKALEYYFKALNIHEELGDKNGVALSNGNIGRVYSSQSDNPKALEYFFNALKKYEETGNNNGIANISVNIGSVYSSQSDYPRALEYYIIALKIHEKIGNKNGIAIVTGNIGTIYQQQNDYPKALEYFFKASNMFEEMGDKEDMALAIGNIGLVYQNQNDYPKALDYYFKQLTIDEGIKNKQGIASVTSNIGAVYSNQKNYTKAIEYMQKSLEISEEIGFQYSVAANLCNIGACFLSILRDTSAKSHKVTGNSESTITIPSGKAALLHEAIEYLQRSLALSKDLHATEIMQEVYENLAQTYKLSGDYKKAVECADNYHAIKDAIFSKENNEKILKMGMKYEYDKKEDSVKAENDKQIALTAETTHRRQIIWAIAGGLFFIGSINWLNVSRKRKLRNTMQQITGLARAKLHNIRSKYNKINLLAIENEKTKNASNEEQPGSLLINYLDKSSVYFKALLNGWTKEQWTIADELLLLRHFYESEMLIKKKVLIVEDFKGVNINKTAFLQEVFTTLLDNSMAYAFPKVTHECVFTISIHKERNLLHVEISDNGQGADINRYRTNDPNQGLNILDARITNAFKLAGRVRKNSPAITISPSIEKGTTIKFDFPYAEVKNTNS